MTLRVEMHLKIILIRVISEIRVSLSSYKKSYFWFFHFD